METQSTESSQPLSDGVQAVAVSRAANESASPSPGRSNKLMWIISLGFLGWLTGMGIGLMIFLTSETVYESVAKIRIEPRKPILLPISTTEPIFPNPESFLPEHHESVIPTSTIVLICVERNNLYNLNSFDHVSREDVIEFVLENLEVEVDSEDSHNYFLRFRTNDPYDAKTVLSNIVSTYKSWLEQRFRDEAYKHISLLRNANSQVESAYQDIFFRLDELDAANLKSGESELNTMHIQALDNRITNAQEELSKRTAYRKRAADTLKEGESESMEDLVWVLIQAGQISADVENPKLEKEEISAEVILRRFLILVEGDVLDLQAEISKNESALQEALAKREQVAIVDGKRTELERVRDLILGRMAAVSDKIFEIDPTGSVLAVGDGFHFMHLQDTSLGERVWPRPLLLGYCGLIGFVGGVCLGILVLLLRVLR